MTKTYKVIKNELDEDVIVETDTIEKTKEYPKQGLIDEIARLQAILAEFDK